MAIGCVWMACTLMLSANSVHAEEKAKHEATDSKSYIVGSGDILEILTWKEEDLSRDVIVRLDGKITFPMVDDVQAAGKTLLQLKQVLQEKLSAFVESPFVTVSLKASGSQKFYILGEVAKTGEYSIVKELTVLQAFSLAGGFTEWAAKDKILLFREENGQKKTIQIDYKDLVKNQDFSKNVRIMADDTIIVP